MLKVWQFIRGRQFCLNQWAGGGGGGGGLGETNEKFRIKTVTTIAQRVFVKEAERSERNESREIHGPFVFNFNSESANDSKLLNPIKISNRCSRCRSKPCGILYLIELLSIIHAISCTYEDCQSVETFKRLQMIKTYLLNFSFKTVLIHLHSCSQVKVSALILTIRH